MADQNFYKPENHEYTTNPTYTGPDCAHCGKPEPGHKPPRQQNPK